MKKIDFDKVAQAFMTVAMIFMVIAFFQKTLMGLVICWTVCIGNCFFALVSALIDDWKQTDPRNIFDN